MNTDPDATPPAGPAPKKPAAEPAKLKCTVLVSGTEVGRLTLGRNHKLRLPEAEAKALAALNPPRVRIDGV